MASDNNDNEEVGYGRPPKSTRFKKGQSGNPRGRRKIVKQVEAEDIGSTLRRVLNQSVAIGHNGKREFVPAIEAVARLVLNEALKGNVKLGIQLITKLADIANAAGPAPVADDRANSAETDEEIIKRFLGRQPGLQVEGGEDELDS